MLFMKLSNQAIEELKRDLIEKYGSSFGLTDEELNTIGVFLITQLAETLKIKMDTNC